MTRRLLVLSMIALAACENPAAPVVSEAPEIPPPPPSRKIEGASSVIDLGLPAGAVTTHAFDVNDRGDIAGYSVSDFGETRAFSWRGSFETLEPLAGYRDSYAFGLNGKGAAIGISQDANGRSVATVWSSGIARSLGTLASGGTSIGLAINGMGSAAGSATAADGSMRGFYYSGLTNGMTSVGVLAGGTYSVGQDLNDWGQMTGYGDTPSGDRAYVYNWWQGTLTDLGTIPGGTSSYGLSVNNSSQVVGFAFTAAGMPHAFLWSRGDMIDLGTLGGDQSVAYGINDAGEVVGYSQDATGEFHAFVWTAKSGMVDLGTLPGGAISYAQQINVKGLTAGIALGTDGREHAVRWDVTLK